MKAVEWNKKEELLHDQALRHLKVQERVWLAHAWQMLKGEGEGGIQVHGTWEERGK